MSPSEEVCSCVTLGGFSSVPGGFPGNNRANLQSDFQAAFPAPVAEKAMA
jgi:hypothetical protein